MRACISILSAIAFLLHLWLGCCAHHGHAAEGAVCHAHGAADQHACEEHGHEQDETPCQPAEQDSTPPSLPCEDGECFFLKASPLEFGGLTFADLLPMLASEMRLEPLAATSFFDPGTPYAPSVRLHLAHQVLLN